MENADSVQASFDSAEAGSDLQIVMMVATAMAEMRSPRNGRDSQPGQADKPTRTAAR